MRTYQSLAGLPAGEFKRLTGVSRTTFLVMVEIVVPMVAARQKKGGPRFTWGVKDMILMALTYWREYRTYFHIGVDYRICESQCFRTVKMVEDALIKDTRFHLKGKHTLLEKKEQGKYLVIDVAESPIERPKKKGEKTGKNSTIQAKRSVTR
jgi:hypothetical protein